MAWYHAFTRRGPLPTQTPAAEPQALTAAAAPVAGPVGTCRADPANLSPGRCTGARADYNTRYNAIDVP